MTFEDPARPGGPARAASPLWLIPAVLVLGLLGAVLGDTVVAGAAGTGPLAQLLESVVFDLAFVLAVLYFLTVRRERVGVGFRRIAPGPFLVVVAGTAAVYYLLTWAYAQALALHATDRLPTGLGWRTSTAQSVGVAVFVLLVAPICEEFFFRGFLFGVLRRMPVRLGSVDLGPWIAALIVAVVFGAAHYDSASSPEFLIPLGFFGFLLCLVRWRTGSLYPCVALHVINNAAALGVNLAHWSFGLTVLVGAAALLAALGLTLPLSRGGSAGPAGLLLLHEAHVPRRPDRRRRGRRRQPAG